MDTKSKSLNINKLETKEIKVILQKKNLSQINLVRLYLICYPGQEENNVQNLLCSVINKRDSSSKLTEFVNRILNMETQELNKLLERMGK